MLYIGARKSKKLNLKEDFWSYGTSSYRQSEILNNPQNFKIRILKEFDDFKEALSYEKELHEKYNVDKNPKFWNRRISPGDGFSCETHTISCYDKKDKKFKRVFESEYYSNKDRYTTAVVGKVTVCLKEDASKFFNITKEEFYSNREKYLTTAQAKNGGVLCRRRGQTCNFYRVPKNTYNKEEYETPIEVKNRYPKNFISVEIIENGERTYIDPQKFDIGKHRIKGDDAVLVVDENGNPYRVSQIEYLKGSYKKYKKIPKEPLREVIYNGAKTKMLLSEYKRLKKDGADIMLANCNFIQKGFVNVKVLETNEHKKITKEEFYSNRHLYETFGAKTSKSLKSSKSKISKEK